MTRVLSNVAVSPRTAIILLTMVFMSGGCSSLRVPAGPPEIPPGRFHGSSHEEVRVSAFPIEGTESQWREFGDDLPRLGIGPLWVRIENEGPATLDLRDLEWTLERGSTRFSGFGEEAILKRYHKKKKIRLYTLRAEEKALYSLKDSALPMILLSPGRSVEGFVYIKINPTLEPAWSDGALLVAREIRLQDGGKISVPIQLVSHAQR